MATVTLPTSIEPRTPQGSFTNETFTDFKHPDQERTMRAALEHLAGQMGRESAVVIGANDSDRGQIRSLNPARPAQVLKFTRKPGQNTQQAMRAALQAFESG
jgi:1-pyrroline-5-carboxylate dehydrogenase